MAYLLSHWPTVFGVHIRKYQAAIILRVFFIGSNSYGSNARSCADSLRRLGCDVFDIDQELYSPPLTSFTSKVGLRLVRSRLVAEFNRAVLDIAARYPHEIFLAFKGTYLLPETLRTIRQLGASLYNFYPDTSAFNSGKWLPLSLPEYDCVFYTKPFWYRDVIKRIPLKNGFFLPHGYDPVVHRPFSLSNRDYADYACDVSLIATHMPHKEGVLTKLMQLRPRLHLRIWGNRWTTHCKDSALRRWVQGFPVHGERYSRAICATKINLAIMGGKVEGASSGDLTTNRTYAIPATGGFMLHERNDEVLSLYREGVEIECFDTPEELAEKIDYYLAHPEKLGRIAHAGHLRCVPAYSYDNRMADLLRWHEEHSSRPTVPSLEDPG
ncbi:MAG TPA: glycosyltransferase [Acidobacteriaceae bacterium]|nr:glycosyltransferase [Acidobacteriaceae bacterium]